MTSDKNPSDSRGSFVGGSGNITTGTFTDSQIVSQSGRAEINNIPAADIEPWLDQLRNEVTRIRRRLEQGRPAVPTADIEDAIEALAALESDIPGMQDSSQAGLRSLRLRVKELIGVLVPVADIVGGMSALEVIMQHL